MRLWFALGLMVTSPLAHAAGGGTQKVQWQLLDMEVPKGWQVMASEQNLVAQPPDGSMMLLVAGMPGITPEQLDEVMEAGPVLPLHTIHQRGETQKARTPLGPLRMADYDAEPVMGDAFVVRYAVLGLPQMAILVMVKAPEDKAAAARKTADATVRSIRYSKEAQQLALAALKEQQRQQQAAEAARQQAMRTFPGRYGYSGGNIDLMTFETWWLCADGTVAKDSSSTAAGAGGPLSRVSGVDFRGRWTVSQDAEGPLLVVQVSAQDVRQYRLGWETAENGAVSALVINGRRYAWEDRNGCRR